MSGRIIARRYRLTEPIGRGAMGVVWRANDELLDRDVAVKEVLISEALNDDERANAYQRTLREARTAARLSHRGVVAIYDVAEDDGRPWIIMELIHGPSLDQVLSDAGPLSPRRAGRMAQQLLAALATAHAARVLHRDVKPSNVLLCDDERAVLTDFGIATFQGDPRLTQTGMVMGSPGYTAPERIRGGPATPASDLWSLGATLFTAVEGHGPFEQRGGAITTMSAIIHEDPPVCSAAGPLGGVIAALMRREPDGRPDALTASRLIADMLPLLRDERAAEATIETSAGAARGRLIGEAVGAGAVGGVADSEASGGEAGGGEAGGGEAGGGPAAVPYVPSGLSAMPPASIVPPSAPAPSSMAPASSARPPGSSAAPPESASKVPSQQLWREVRSQAWTEAPSPAPSLAPQQPAPASQAPGGPATPRRPVGSGTPMSSSVTVGTEDPPTKPQPEYPYHSPASPRPQDQWRSYEDHADDWSMDRRRVRRRPRLRMILSAMAVLIAATAGAAAALEVRHHENLNTTPPPTVLLQQDPALVALNAPVGSPPPGYVSFRESPAAIGTTAGFSIGVPPRWNPNPVRVTFRAWLFKTPNDRGYLEVDLTQHTFANNLRQAQFLETSREGHLLGYRRIALHSATIRKTAGALWEFTWLQNGVRMRAEDFLFTLPTAQGQSYALYLQVPDSEWKATLPTFETMLSTFHKFTG